MLYNVILSFEAALIVDIFPAGTSTDLILTVMTHRGSVDGKPVGLRRLPGCDCLFDLCKVDHGDSFLAFLGDDSFRHKKSPHLRKKAEMEARLEQFMLTSCCFLTTMILSTFLFSEEIP